MAIDRKTWYSFPEVLFNIITVCRDREIRLLAKAEDKTIGVSNIFANYMDLLKKNIGLAKVGDDDIDPFRFLKFNFNLYYSLCKYDNIKLFSFHIPKRREQNKIWSLEAMNNIRSLDFGMDFDSEDWRESYKEAKLIKDDLDKYSVPYTIKWSGRKGFHIVIPYSALPDYLKLVEDSDDSLYEFTKALGETISNIYAGKLTETYPQAPKNQYLATMDLSVFDPRRVWKCDYSYVCETGLIALPLSDEQFNNFDPSMCKPEEVLKNGIRNRGQLMRKGGKEEFKKWCEEELLMNW